MGLSRQLTTPQEQIRRFKYPDHYCVLSTLASSQLSLNTADNDKPQGSLLMRFFPKVGGALGALSVRLSADAKH